MEYSRGLLESIYRTMIKIRFCEESLVGPISKGDIRTPCHLYSGEEAVAAGIGASLDVGDYIFGNHRSHGHFLTKGGSINELIAEVYCKETGCSRGRGGSMHLIDPDHGMLGSAPIVAGTISLAVGAALAASIRKEKRVSICFFGDGATGEGVLYESLNFAALKKLPIVFACENNLYATHMPIRECRSRSDIHKIAEPFGIESHQIDGNDVLQVYEVGRKAIDRCRKGKGPVFLECLTYRFRGHVGPDDNIQGSHTDIRPKDELEEWLRKDPIELFEDYLKQAELLDRKSLDQIRSEVQAEVAEAHRIAQDSPEPEKGDLKKYVYR